VRTSSALEHSNGPEAKYGAELALALVDGSNRVQALADDLDKLFSENTIVQFNYLPTLDAQLALRRNEASTAPLRAIHGRGMRKRLRWTTTWEKA
jgi:eukaryotic-like serine/threonine-protein kinase